MPVDQLPFPMMQSDDINGKRLKYVAHGDILIPSDEIDSSNSQRYFDEFE